jgi:hypothetical protein
MMADGVTVGSACVKTIGGSENPVEEAREFARSFEVYFGRKATIFNYQLLTKSTIEHNV